MSRTCPRCRTELTGRTSGGIEVDVCDTCRGVYFDPAEFDRLIAERFEQRRLESTFAFVATPADNPLPCPSCGEVMDVVDHDGLELDRCAACEGLWVDREELDAIAAQARAREENVPREFLRCAGCGARVPKRSCIRRMDDWWCEQCVIDGNHPGPEAQLVGIKERQAMAAASFATARANQAARREQQKRLNTLAQRKTSAGRMQPRARLGILGARVVAWIEDLFLQPRWTDSPRCDDD